VGLVPGEGEGDGLRGFGGAVLDGESELVADAAQVEVGIAPVMVSPALC